MKKSKTMSVLLVATFFLSMIVGTAAVSASEDVQTEIISPPDRDKWWNPEWHYRMYFTADANDYARRWGRFVDHELGLDAVTGLDANSIRLVLDGVEIPSMYDVPTDTILFTINETLSADDVITYTVYYDTISNGLKPVPDYGYEWVEEYMSTWQSYEQYIEDRDAARDEYYSQYQIQEIGGVHKLRGETVVYDEVDGRWEYLNGTACQYYIVGDGTFFWYNGQQVYADDQGNWYYAGNDSRIVCALYFDEGEYYWYLDEYTQYHVYHDEYGVWYFDVEQHGSLLLNIFTVDPISDIYTTTLPSIIRGDSLYYTLIYRDPYTGIWYYEDNGDPIPIGMYDPETREFYYDGNHVYQDGDGDWRYDDPVEGTVAFASETSSVYYYRDQMVYLDDNETPEDPTDDVWYYEDGTEVIGYAYFDEGTGEWMVYVGTALEELGIIDGTLWYEDEFITYNEGTGVWQFENGTTVIGEVEEDNKVAWYGDQIVYYDSGSATWYYENGAVVQAYVYYDSIADMYYAYYDGIEHAIYEDGGIVYYWNGTEWHAYGPADVDGQSFYVSSTWTEGADCGLDVTSMETSDPDFGMIASSVSWLADVYSPGGSFMETIVAQFYRDVPDIFLTFDSDTDGSVDLGYGGALFNLNGTIGIGDYEYGANNISEYWDDIQSDLLTFGVVAGEITSADVSSMMTLGSAVTIISEVGCIDVNDLDWGSAYDMSGIYDTGKTYGAGEKLEVIPILLDTKYVGIYDVVEQSGYGLVLDNPIPSTSFLVEAWKETLSSGVYYYVNVSANYVDWWYTATGPIHIEQPLDYTLTYAVLDGTGDADPVTTLEDLAGDIPDIIVTNGDSEPSIEIEIGTIIAPLKTSVGAPTEFVVAIKGETLGSLTYKIDSGVEVEFDLLSEFIINNVPIRHYGIRGETNITFESAGQKVVTISAYDTNGSVLTKTARITVNENASVIWTWIASVLAAIFGFFGIATIKSRRASRKVDCIGGACNI